MMKTLPIAACLLCAPAAAEVTAPVAEATPPVAESREYGRFGLSLKSGEAAGAMGIQFAWNFNCHVQVCAGAGGVADLDPFLTGDRGRTDSYFLLGKAYWDHAYLATGYSLKVSRFEKTLSGEVLTASRAENGIPLHVGYEFGHRSGFYFSTSIGYLYVLGGGQRDVAQGTAAEPSKSRTAKSGPSAGVAVGYYLW
jgi:hypothetical protein